MMTRMTVQIPKEDIVVNVESFDFIRLAGQHSLNLSHKLKKEKHTMKLIALTGLLCLGTLAMAQDVHFDYDRSANFSTLQDLSMGRFAGRRRT